MLYDCTNRLPSVVPVAADLQTVSDIFIVASFVSSDFRVVEKGVKNVDV